MNSDWQASRITVVKASIDFKDLTDTTNVIVTRVTTNIKLQCHVVIMDLTDILNIRVRPSQISVNKVIMDFHVFKASIHPTVCQFLRTFVSFIDDPEEFVIINTHKIASLDHL